MCHTKKCPNEEYNLGSINPSCIRELLSNLIKKVGSKSFVLPTQGKDTKLILSILVFFGLEIMCKEQYMIADENYILDISKAERELEWKPMFSDMDMLVESYKNYKTMKVGKL